MTTRIAVGRSLAAAAVLFSLAGCSGATTESGQSNTSVTSSGPDRLSFVQQGDEDGAATPEATASTGLSVDTPETLTATEGADVYSGADVLYTKVATIVAGDLVQSTGVSIEVDDVLWLEIEISAGTGWVDARHLQSPTGD